MTDIELAIYWIIALIFIGLGFFAMWFYAFRFKHHIVIRELAKGRKLVLFDRARDFVEDGVKYWQLRKEKDKEMRLMPVPPAETIEIMKRGKKFVEVYRTETGEYIFLKDEGEVKKFPEEVFEITKLPEEIGKIKSEAEKANAIKTWKEEIRESWKEQNKVIDAYQPLTSKQRLILINNIRKAHQRKGFSLREHIPTIVSISALVIIIIALMIFWGDLARPIITANNQRMQMQTLQKEQLQIIKEIKHGIQSIESEQERLDQKVKTLEQIPD